MSPRKKTSWGMIIAVVVMTGVLGYALDAARKDYAKANARALLWKDIVDCSSQAIIVTDENGVIEDWNNGAEKLFGHSAKEVVGRGLGFLMPDTQRESHEEAFFDEQKREELLAGKKVEMTCWAVNKGNELINVSIRIQAVKMNHGHIGIHFIAQIDPVELIEQEFLPKPDAPNKEPPDPDEFTPQMQQQRKLHYRK